MSTSPTSSLSVWNVQCLDPNPWVRDTKVGLELTRVGN